MKTEEEIQAEVDKALETMPPGDYRDAIEASLDWVLGRREEAPTED